MNAYQKISTEINKFFEGNNILKLLLPLDMIIVFACAGLMVLNNFISVGGLLYSIAYYGFFFGLVLAFSKQNNKVLYTGLFIVCASNLYQVLKYGIFQKYVRFLDYQSLIGLIIFGWLGYLILRYELSSTNNNEEQ